MLPPPFRSISRYEGSHLYRVVSRDVFSIMPESISFSAFVNNEIMEKRKEPQTAPDKR